MGSCGSVGKRQAAAGCYIVKTTLSMIPNRITIYLCPARQVLTYAFDATYRKKDIRPSRHHKKHYTTSACRTCGVRSFWTTNKNGRILTRWVDEHILDEMAQRLVESPDVLNKRRELVEHPFGTLKFWYGYAYFLVKGLNKVKAEFSLMSLAYNIKRTPSTSSACTKWLTPSPEQLTRQSLV